MPRSKSSIDTIRVRTTSEHKWNYVAPVIRNNGFVPQWDATVARDETEIHEMIHYLIDDLHRYYPIRVAQMKQAFDPLPQPVITLDTVTLLDGYPYEKPQDLSEAYQCLCNMNGHAIITEIGWDFGMMLASRASAEFFHTTRILCRLKNLPPEMIQDYVSTSPIILQVSAGLDLSTVESRLTFIDMAYPVLITKTDHLGHAGHILRSGKDIVSPMFDPYFAGVPIHAIDAFFTISE